MWRICRLGHGGQNNQHLSAPLSTSQRRPRQRVASPAVTGCGWLADDCGLQLATDCVFHPHPNLSFGGCAHHGRGHAEGDAEGDAEYAVSTLSKNNHPNAHRIDVHKCCVDTGSPSKQKRLCTPLLSIIHSPRRRTLPSTTAVTVVQLWWLRPAPSTCYFRTLA